MQDICCQEIDQVLLTTKEIYYDNIHVLKKYHLYLCLKQKMLQKILIIYKNKENFVDRLFRRTYFCDTAIPCGSEKNHNVIQLNPDEDKYYLLTPYPTLMPPSKKFSPASIKAIARNTKNRSTIIMYKLQIRYTTSHPHTTISRIPPIFRHLHTRLQLILSRHKRLHLSKR